MFSKELQELVLQVLGSWQVITVTIAVFFYFFLVTSAARFRRSRAISFSSKPKKKKKEKANAAPGGEDAEAAEEAINDELGLEESD
jgi:hypothetical protein